MPMRCHRSPPVPPADCASMTVNLATDSDLSNALRALAMDAVHRSSP